MTRKKSKRLAFAFLQKRLKNNQPVNIPVCMPFILIPTFFASFSQEQTGLALLISLFLLIAIGQGKEWKKFRKLNEPVLFTAFVSYILLFAAPGNYARLETNEFSELSFFEKIANNMPPIEGRGVRAGGGIFARYLALILNSAIFT